MIFLDLQFLRYIIIQKNHKKSDESSTQNHRSVESPSVSLQMPDASTLLIMLHLQCTLYCADSLFD